ncbi:MAG: OmpL47-type beta-barrel domain-containing protein [Bacteroidales bacterium]
MNKKFTLLIPFILFVFITSGFAQSQKNHEKRTYTDSDGKFYINRDLPVYLRLSTSKEKDADSKLLESESTSEYTNPMYFDTEGKNTIRSPHAVDPESKQQVQPKREIVFEVYADGIAPNTSSRFYGAPTHYSGGTQFYGKGLNVKLTSKDAVSGVENIWQSVNKENYKEYNDEINMDSEGDFTLSYYANDMVGNAEEPERKEFVVDLTAPESDHSTSQPKLNDILSPKAKISLSSSDELSGVKITRYGFDGAANKGYTNDISLGQLSDGEHTLKYYSTDNVDNDETENTYEFYLDRTPPEISSEIVGDIHKGKNTYISSRTKIKLKAEDNKAGVKEIRYSIDEQSYNTYDNTFKMPDKTGRHSVKYYAEDKVTNRNKAKYLNVPSSGPLYMDNRKPSTSISYGQPQFFNRDTLFVNKSTDITLSPRDAHSGVQVTHYKVNGGSEKSYDAPFTIAEEGYHTIEFRTKDNVNNKESFKESAVFVDNTPPDIYTNFSINAIGSKQKDGESYKVYPRYTRLYIGATDKHAGNNKIYYSINGGDFEEYSSPYTLDVSEVDHFKEEKFYKVDIKVEDKLGNEASTTVRFFVEEE